MYLSSLNNLREVKIPKPAIIDTLLHDISKVIYIPALNNASKYVRGAGYFSSSVYRLMTAELLQFCMDGGQITLLTSTEWQQRDYDAVKESYSDTNVRTSEYYIEQLVEMLKNEKTRSPTKMLVALMHSGKLSVKVAVVKGNIYHEKTGFFEDNDGNIILFHGTGNESKHALELAGQANSFSIFYNWGEGENGWNDYGSHHMEKLLTDIRGEGKLEVDDFIEIDERFLNKWDIETDISEHMEKARSRSKHLIDVYDEVYGASSESNTVSLENTHPAASLTTDASVHGLGSKEIISPTELVKGRKHQGEALQAWKDADFKGILKHATGSGKTITALSAIEQHLVENKPVILVVPGIPLLNQWEDEIHEKLGLNIDLALFGDGRQKNEDYSLFKAIMNKGLSSPTLILCTKDTLTGQTVSPLLKNTDEENLANILFVFDECHKAGEPKWRSLMNLRFGKSLGLSATPERAIGIADDGSEHKENGNDIIASLLGEVVHTFDLKDAIDAEYLTGFRYYLHEAELTIAEQKEYDEERKKIGQWGGPPDQNIAIHKARRIVKKAKNKIPIAAQIISDNFNLGDYWLIYCATTPMLNEVRAQIGRLNPSLQKEIYEFHSKNKAYRDKDLESYRRQGGIMLAMKCLDEGVNIPNITHGIVLSSSTIEREFIQRRGRMLRKAEGKELAHIYDVICLPHSSASPSSRESILKHERNRVEEFGSISMDANQVRLKLLLLK